ncbi:protein tolkin-like [Cotesia typhae]|uniref:protein tolkin-like n=1 Tax=Cotesia typhae TaxID=2053667 RepID=UPI003D6974B5
MLNFFIIILKLILIKELITPQKNFLCASEKVRLKRSVATEERSLLWNDGIIPYEIDDSFSGLHRKFIRKVMQKWEKSTCIQFVDRNDTIHQDYLALIHPDSRRCHTAIGKSYSGRNELYLGKGCLNQRNILHELGHVIGFHHEHNRPDRDQYVNVKMENVKSGSEGNFDKLSPEKITTLNQKYDYNSIMHYRRNEFSSDQSKDTIVPLQIENNEIDEIDTLRELSDIDIIATNLLYRCRECGKTLQDPEGTFGTAVDANASPTSKKYCQWRISTSHGERIVLYITSLNIIKSSPKCQTDYLQITDGYSTINPLLASICGKHRIVDPIISSGNRMLITYRTDHFNEMYNGFTARYKKICGGDIKIENENQNYYLESPNYPSLYEDNKKCVWHLISPLNRKISIKFNYFKLEESLNCENDFVEIKNGDNSNLSSVGTYCGKNSPGEVISEGNKLIIKFVSDHEIQGNGFSAIITMVKSN